MATNSAQAGAAIERAFEAAWQAETPVEWPNTVLTPPDERPWIRFSVKYSTPTEPTINPQHRHWRYVGFVSVQIFTPLNAGLFDSRRLTDIVVGFFRGKTIENIQFSAPLIEEVGPQVDGWFQCNVRAPFYYDVYETVEVAVQEVVAP